MLHNNQQELSEVVGLDFDRDRSRFLNSHCLGLFRSETSKTAKEDDALLVNAACSLQRRGCAILI